ncbi:uncharacterized protein LOC131658089 [Vicia villosa]|uniref:uncharacterized protein LOC131658089 n=1 Tax=Vicia villosa TaxID=3911 RepID=UPI00273AAD78|nr:uncharacterized protein LOC131658089 [Vicia villosa]
MGKIATALSSRPQGELPSSTEAPTTYGVKNVETCKVIKLRSGKECETPPRKEAGNSGALPLGDNTEEEEEEEEDVPAEEPTSVDTIEDGFDRRKMAESAKQPQVRTPVVNEKKFVLERPPPPFPQRIRKAKKEQQFGKKCLLKRKRLGEFTTVALNQECSQLVQGKLPPKLKYPGSFTIPCNIGDSFCGKALCNLGASINLTPLSVFKKLGIGAARPTTITLQMVDSSICYPQGKIEDVLVRVDRFVFLADFIIMDFDADEDIPILLGRPFLATGRTLINVEKGELTMRVNGL